MKTSGLVTKSSLDSLRATAGAKGHTALAKKHCDNHEIWEPVEFCLIRLNLAHLRYSWSEFQNARCTESVNIIEEFKQLSLMCLKA